MNSRVNEDFAEIGRTDEGRSRRTLAPETARRMVAVREARKAYRRFHTSCFWSHRPNLDIGMNDVEWVAEQLMKHGDREAWLIGKSLCR